VGRDHSNDGGVWRLLPHNHAGQDCGVVRVTWWHHPPRAPYYDHWAELPAQLYDSRNREAGEEGEEGGAHVTHDDEAQKVYEYPERSNPTQKGQFGEIGSIAEVSSECSNKCSSRRRNGCVELQIREQSSSEQLQGVEIRLAAQEETLDELKNAVLDMQELLQQLCMAQGVMLRASGSGRHPTGRHGHR